MKIRLNKNYVLKYKISQYIISKQNSIFVTLIINEDITKKYPIRINDKNFINLYEYVNFIALKNGMHDQKGYYYSNFEKPSMANNQHIKTIFRVIDNYF